MAFKISVVFVTGYCLFVFSIIHVYNFAKIISDFYLNVMKSTCHLKDELNLILIFLL
jgi:hypothetical protein